MTNSNDSGIIIIEDSKDKEIFEKKKRTKEEIELLNLDEGDGN